ncbi:homoserine dehydrogenase [Anaerolineales bacterium HSG25]|nr:homoserine dehydrogenase [Anaerolineales bacterium HSG25]
MIHKLALIGFGTVGQGLAEILIDKADTLRATIGFEAQIVAVSDLLKGSVYHPDGLDITTLLDVVKTTGRVDDYPSQPGLERGWDSLKTIRETNADSIVEVSYTDIQTGQPAIGHCRAAFTSGKHAVISNKGPVALAYDELSHLAKENNVRFGFEGTVMSGTPAIRMPLTALTGTDIREVRGIFNGTTNYILTEMEKGLDYEIALQQAQQLGYAEADPTADVEGYDAMGKVVILANVIMGQPLQKSDVPCKGISHLTSADIEQATREGKRWKLIGRVKKDTTGVSGSVAPEMIPVTDPLASIMGATNAITYESDLAGPITLVGAGAGRVETGFSILIDLINIARGQI